MMTTPSTASFGSPRRERLGDAWKDRDVELFRARPGQVAFGKLVDVERHQIDLRLAPPPAPAVAEQEAVDEMLRVRMRPARPCRASAIFLRGASAAGERRRSAVAGERPDERAAVSVEL